MHCDVGCEDNGIISVVWTPSEDFVVTPRLLGRGGFGEVHLGFHRLDYGRWERLAVKQLITPQDGLSGFSDLWGAAIDEANACSELSEIVPVTKMLKPWFDVGTKRVNLPFEYCDMDFCRLMHIPGKYPRGALSSIVFQCLLCLERVHYYGYVHRDVKPENLLLQVACANYRSKGAWLSSPVVKMADFGLAARVVCGGTESRHCVGTLQYLAPECFRREEALMPTARDVWALGCTLYYLLTRRKAFDASRSRDVASLVFAGMRTVPLHDICESVTERNALIELTLLMLTANPLERPTAKALIGILHRKRGGVRFPLPLSPRVFDRLFVCGGADTRVLIYSAPSENSPQSSREVLRPGDFVFAGSQPGECGAGWVKIVYPAHGYCLLERDGAVQLKRQPPRRSPLSSPGLPSVAAKAPAPLEKGRCFQAAAERAVAPSASKAVPDTRKAANEHCMYG